MKLKLKNLIFLFILILSFNSQVFAENIDKTTYYIGESKMTSPQGIPYGSSISLIKRTILEKENKIIEDVISLDLKRPCSEFITIFDVKENNFKISDNKKTFSGDGILTGEKWNWNGWKYDVALNNNAGFIKGEDNIINNEIIVKKEFYNKDKKVTVKFNEQFKPISKEFFEIIYKNIKCDM